MSPSRDTESTSLTPAAEHELVAEGLIAWRLAIDRFLTGGRYSSKHTRAAYRRALLRLAEFATGRSWPSPASIDAALLELYGGDLLDWGVAPATRSQHIGAIRSFIQWLAVWLPMPGTAQLARVLPYPKRPHGDLGAVAADSAPATRRDDVDA